MLHVHDIREPLDELFDEIRPEAVFHLAAQADVRVSVEQPGRGRRGERDRDDPRARGGAPPRRAGRVRSTGGAIYGECDRAGPRGRPARTRSRRTGRRSSPARSTCGCTTGCTGRSTSAFASETSTGRGRIRTARPESSRSSSAPSRRRAGADLRRRHARRGTTSTSETSRGRRSRPSARTAACSTSAPGARHPWSSSTSSAAGPPARSVEAVHAPARLGELQRSFLDPSRAAAELGFMPMVGLEDGLQATWEWVDAGRTRATARESNRSWTTRSPLPMLSSGPGVSPRTSQARSPSRSSSCFSSSAAARWSGRSRIASSSPPRSGHSRPHLPAKQPRPASERRYRRPKRHAVEPW